MPSTTPPSLAVTLIQPNSSHLIVRTTQAALSRAVAKSVDNGVTLVDVSGLSTPSDGVALEGVDLLIACVVAALRRADELDLAQPQRKSSLTLSSSSLSIAHRQSSLSASPSITASTSSSSVTSASSDGTDWSNPDSEAVFRGGWREFATAFIQHGRRSVTLRCDACSTKDEVPQGYTASAPNPVVE